MTPLILFILFTFLSAAIRAIDHIGLWGQLHATCLPKWLWNWSIPRLRSADSEHFYMGLYLVLFGAACFYFPVGYKNDWRFYFLVAAYILIYFEIFNLFFHVIFKERKWQEWPFLRMFLT